MQLGFLGFGEVGSTFANGLRAEGLEATTAYDCNPARSLVESNADLAAKCDVIISVVTASSALQAAIATAPFLNSSHIFCDCNSVSPQTKNQISGVISASGCAFVEGAIMAPVHGYKQRVPILLNGAHAHKLAGLLEPYGMRFSIMQGEPGSAAAVKMCRSIMVKGIEALMMECTRAARHFGCESAVFASLAESFPGFEWKEMSVYMAERVHKHGLRRAAEMKEVASMQQSAGLASVMSLATAEVQSANAQGV
jgi:3-hydroxyisobutyrate dehydrogenase-like beta-hydroxyacid dehydrogenase